MHGPLRQPLIAAPHIRSRETGRAFAVLLALALLARIATFANPVVGLDEQFYLLVGDRMLQGALPYIDIFDRKPIGLFLIYAGARLLGGDGFLAYKLVALAFVALTALGIYRLARRMTPPFGALIAACLFILWHDFMGGEGGQSPIFYDLFMVLAALCVAAAIERPSRLLMPGSAAMLCVGLAIQIKYSVLFEGIYFGCMLIWLAVRQGISGRMLARAILLWISAALLPTLAALGIYAALGHADAFIFDNFVSFAAQGRNPLATQLRDLLEIMAILSPLIIVLLIGWRRGDMARLGAMGLFVGGWFLASLAGILIFWRFNAPHYAIPLLLPLTVWLAPIFDAPTKRPAVSMLLVFLAAVMGQVVLACLEERRGGPAEAMQVARAARPEGEGCIYVYSGYPALYMLTGSCLPTRWAFPGSLNMKDEESAQAIGIDPAGEVRRIMAHRPPVVVDEYPRSRFGNPATAAILDQALAKDYVLSACPSSGAGRAHLIYRLKRERAASRPLPAGCPAPHVSPPWPR